MGRKSILCHGLKRTVPYGWYENGFGVESGGEVLVE